MIVYFIQDTEIGLALYQGEAKETESMWLLNSPVGGRKKIFKKDPMADADRITLLNRYIMIKQQRLKELEYEKDLELKRISIVDDVLEKGE